MLTIAKFRVSIFVTEIYSHNFSLVLQKKYNFKKHNIFICLIG